MDKGFEEPFGMEGEGAADVATPPVPKHKRDRKPPKKDMPEGRPGVYLVQLRHAPFLKQLKRGKVKAKSPADAWEQFMAAGKKHGDAAQVAAFAAWCNDRDPADDPDIEVKREE